MTTSYTANRTPARPGYDMAKVRAFAKRLEQARLAAGFSSRDAAARHIGVRSSVYHRHEGAVLMATVWLIERYAAAFGCSPGWLAFGSAAAPRKAVAPPRGHRFVGKWRPRVVR
jgi:hypothetical protein